MKVDISIWRRCKTGTSAIDKLFDFGKPSSIWKFTGEGGIVQVNSSSGSLQQSFFWNRKYRRYPSA